MRQGCQSVSPVPMRLFSWNCQGLGNPWTVRALHNLVRMKVPQILFLSETRQDAKMVEVLRCRLGFQGCFTVPTNRGGNGGGGGGLAFLWDESVHVEVKSFSSSHIDVVVEDVGGGGFLRRVTGFYGHPEGGRRRESWNLLKSLGNQFDLPWVCCGDFNELVESSEKVGGLVRSDWQMRQFREALSEAGLSSLPSSGPRFTWRGRRHGVGWIKERLDRFVANGEWLALYPSLCCINVVSSASDHCPIFMEANPITQGFRRKRFRFEAMWLTHAQCKDQVELAWGSAIEGDPLAQVTRKIKDCKTNLMAWDKDVFGNVTRKIKVESKKLEALERLPAGELVEEQICCLKKELNALLGKEEIMWRQRSRVQWLREGDRNTKFFHVRANQRKRRNGMEGLFDHNGQWVTGQKDIAQVTVQYFHSIFSTSHPTDAEMSAVLDQVSPKVTEEMNQALGKEFTAVEVGAALAQMGPTKAPGPDGMPPIFYRSFWPQIGTTVTQAVLECLNQGVSLQSINHTHLVLIPKKLSLRWSRSIVL